jgi:hypothetical protein
LLYVFTGQPGGFLLGNLLLGNLLLGNRAGSTGAYMYAGCPVKT